MHSLPCTVDHLIYKLGYRLDSLGLESWLEKKIFLFSRKSRLALGPTNLLFNGY